MKTLKTLILVKILHVTTGMLEPIVTNEFPFKTQVFDELRIGYHLIFVQTFMTKKMSYHILCQNLWLFGTNNDNNFMQKV
jgi:hypothetical protein